MRVVTSTEAVALRAQGYVELTEGQALPPGAPGVLCVRYVLRPGEALTDQQLKPSYTMFADGRDTRGTAGASWAHTGSVDAANNTAAFIWRGNKAVTARTMQGSTQARWATHVVLTPCWVATFIHLCAKHAFLGRVALRDIMDAAPWWWRASVRLDEMLLAAVANAVIADVPADEAAVLLVNTLKNAKEPT